MAKAFPLVFNFAINVSLFCALFLHRTAKDEDGMEFSCYADRDTTLANIAKFIIGLFIIIHTFIFYIHYIILYIIYLFIFFIGYRHYYSKR